MSRAGWILVEGADHSLYPVLPAEEPVVWNMKDDSYCEYVGRSLEDDEKLVIMTVAS